MNEIFKTVSNQLVSDVKNLALQPHFSLRNIPEIRTNFVGPSVSRQSHSTHLPFTFEQFKSVLQNHQQHKILECQVLLQTSLSLRMSNLFNLNENTVFQNKCCKKCNFYGVCDILQPFCLHQVIFKETKTSQIKVPIIPQVLPCYFHLRSINQKLDSKQYEIYASFVKTNFGVKTHDLRRFLVNFHGNVKSQNNTDRWSNATCNTNIDRFYLHPDSKFVELCQYLRSY